MVVELIGVLIPVIAILAAFGFASLRHYTRHRERMEELRRQDLARAAQSDRELLSYDGNLLSAHLTAVLERLGSIEQRLEEMDGRSGASGTIAASPAWGEEAREPPDRRQIEAQRH